MRFFIKNEVESMTTKGEENFSDEDYSSPFLVCFEGICCSYSEKSTIKISE
jgi:hypothetical protein